MEPRACGIELASSFLEMSGTRGKTPWVDQACADCPGFPVPGCWRCPLNQYLHSCIGPSSRFLDLLRPPPTTSATTGHTAQVFQHKGAHTEVPAGLRTEILHLESTRPSCWRACRKGYVRSHFGYRLGFSGSINRCCHHSSDSSGRGRLSLLSQASLQPVRVRPRVHRCDKEEIIKMILTN